MLPARLEWAKSSKSSLKKWPEPQEPGKEEEEEQDLQEEEKQEEEKQEEVQEEEVKQELVKEVKKPKAKKMPCQKASGSSKPMEVDQEGPVAGSSSDGPATVANTRLAELKASLDQKFKLDKSLEKDAGLEVGSYTASVAGTALTKGCSYNYWAVKTDQSLDKRLCIDWHQTLAINSRVPAQNIRALQALQEHEFSLLLCSFCGYKREKEVRHFAEELERVGELRFERKLFTRDPLGKRGKCYAAMSQKCGIIIDDRSDVCKEALTKGLLA